MGNQKLKEARERYAALQTDLADPEVTRNQKRYRELMQEASGLRELVEAAERLDKVSGDLEAAREMATAAGEEETARAGPRGAGGLEKSLAELEEQIKVLLIPKDPLDLRNIIMEIRAGHRRRGGGPLRGGPLPHVPALRREDAAGRSSS